MPEIKIISDPDLFDYSFIYEKLITTYWGSSRTLEIIEKSFRNSLSAMIYIDNQPAGFGRIVTDYAVFAYVADIYIDTAFRGQSLSKTLMHYFMNHDSLKSINKWMLVTQDAHELYARYGFSSVKQPERYMEYYPNK